MKELLLMMMSMIMLYNVSAQSDSTGLAFSFNGYLKDLNTFSFPIQQQKSSYTQLLQQDEPEMDIHPLQCIP